MKVQLTPDDPPMTLDEGDIRLVRVVAGWHGPVRPVELRGHCEPFNSRFMKLHRYGILAREAIPSWTPYARRVNYLYSPTEKASRLLKLLGVS